MMLSNGKVAKMPDKKLTDSEIVKALEEVLHRIKGATRIIIPQKSIEEIYNVLQNALDLINRLQAENERLKEETKIMSAYVKGNRWGLISFVEFCKNLKAEAYKECLEKVEQRDVSESDFYIMVKKTEFDNLLKELVGDK